MAAGPDSAKPGSAKPVRELGRWSLAAIGLGTAVGAGIYSAPATLAASLGAASLLAYVAAAATVGIFAHSMAVLGRAFELSGGPYMYVGATFGSFWGFLVGWFFLLARFTATGAVTNVFVNYLGGFLPAVASGLGRAVTIALVLGFITAINVAGIRGASRVMNVFAVVKVAPLLLFALLGAFFAEWDRLAITAVPDAGAFGRGVLLLVFVFGGFEFVTVPAEECRRPTEHVPFALASTVVLSTIVFMSIQAVALSVAPDLGQHQNALAHAATVIAGQPAALAVTAAALAAAAGTVFSNILVPPRMLYALSRDGFLPAWVGTIHPRFRTPATAVILVGAIGAALAISGSFAYLAALSAAARLVTYGGCCAAVLRRNGRRGFANTVLPATGVALCVVLFLMLPPRDLLIAAGAAAACTAVYFATRPLRRDVAESS